MPNMRQADVALPDIESTRNPFAFALSKGARPLRLFFFIYIISGDATRPF